MSILNEIKIKNMDIEQSCDDIIAYVNYLKSKISNLSSENENLKKGIWEKEEIARLKEENETMQKEYYRGFPISEEEEKKINEFKDKYKGQHFGTIGGAFTYQFIPTSIGLSGKIIGPDGKELEFCELD